MSVRVLVCGFHSPGRSGKAAAALMDEASGPLQQERLPGEVQLQVLRLPFSHSRAPAAAVQAVRERRPDYFLLLGTDPGSSDYKLHVFAANFADDAREDEDGSVWVDRILDPDGPVAYRSRLPLDGIWDKFIVERVPVRMSHKAGLWVYNHVLYSVFRAVDEEGLAVRCGGIECPPLEGEVEGEAQSRSTAQLQEELRMVLAVLGHLDPAVDTPGTGRETGRTT